MVTRSKYTPAIGSKVRFSTCGTIATVTGHTDRGFTYKDGPVLSIPRLGVLGTGEGECFTDMPQWDCYVIAYKPEEQARPLTRLQVETLARIGPEWAQAPQAPNRAKSATLLSLVDRGLIEMRRSKDALSLAG